MKFRVLRAHQGDRFYHAGDEREALEADVAHLVRSGTLAKAAPEVADKAAPKSQTKAAK